MISIDKTIKEIGCTEPGRVPKDVYTSLEPVVIRGLVTDWPLVKMGLKSAPDAGDYLKSFYQNIPVTASIGDPDIEGRIFYNKDFSGFNYQSIKADLGDLLDNIYNCAEQQKPPTFYMASTFVDRFFTGFCDQNPLDLNADNPLVSVWLGNRSRIAAHYDLPDNIACCAVGRRRFTLFPPDQLVNLYPGPIDWAPGGQPISLVDFKNPDYKQFPNFKYALESAQVTTLESGDGLYIPSMWWHHVEGLDALNILVNYWWRQSPNYMDTPANTLLYALMSIRDLPVEQKKIWRGMFDYYIFDADKDSHSHIPEQARGSLGLIDESLNRKIRSLLLKKINR
ncbi:MAG: cupin-like domain-containing protein [Porticoccaceae bacterium]